MTPPAPADLKMLAAAEAEVQKALPAGGTSQDARLDILEGAVAALTGMSLSSYRGTDDFERELDPNVAENAGQRLAKALLKAPIPPPLALATLARSDLTGIEQRRKGAYYTDWRLALHLATGLGHVVHPNAQVVDPAVGSGILLAAIGVTHFAVGGPRDAFVAELAHAADLEHSQLRATKLALASLTRDVEVCRALTRNLRVHDSLAGGTDAWVDRAPGGFDLVVGNPPWEKLRITHHEHLRAGGTSRHYGADHDGCEDSALLIARERMARYVAELREPYALAGAGEVDLYRLFVALAINLVREEGQIAYLVPAGLIRSQGTRDLRAYLLEQCPELAFTIFDNRARFFPIDTRFKFVSMHAVRSAHSRRSPLKLRHAEGTSLGVQTTGEVRLSRRELEALRPDLTVPEVRSSDEWRLFRSMYGASPAVTVRPFGPVRPVREVDMSLAKANFVKAALPNTLPVIEGRMIQAFRCGAKTYAGGTGRRAHWDHQEVGADRIEPQWWLPRDALPEAIRNRAGTARVGFCDIVGQTNERTMMAARIPSGVICGNKVPTIRFEDDDDQARSDLWLGVVNSFAFDWLLRRVVTTTVNFFLLQSIPLPALEPRSGAGAKIVNRVRDLHRLVRAEDPDLKRRSELRADIDALVAHAYGIRDDRDLQLLFRDFPLVDHDQPAPARDHGSTVTKDAVRLSFSRLTNNGLEDSLAKQLASALADGAQAYVPREFARVEKAGAGRDEALRAA